MLAQAMVEKLFPILFLKVLFSVKLFFSIERDLSANFERKLLTLEFIKA